MIDKNDLEIDEFILYDKDGFTLTEQSSDDEMSLYTVYDEVGDIVGSFYDLTLTDAEKRNIKNTTVYKSFLDIIDSGYETWDKWYDDDYPLIDLTSKSKPIQKTPEEIEAENKRQAELVEELCKSDTIVFHQKDKTTVMLNPIYEGKGWDVYQGSSYNGELTKESIHELIKRHDRVVCLGHGTSHGLLSGIIGEDEVPLLKDKKIFSMWCYAATFWKNNGFKGHGILTSDNFPSEVWECKSACDASVSAEWIYDNMVLAGNIAGQAIDMGWDNPEKACEFFRKEYSTQSIIETEDEQKVVDFNTNSMQVV